MEFFPNTKGIIETLKGSIKKIYSFEETAETIGITIGHDLGAGELEGLILDLLHVPKDNTTSEEHSKCWETENFCKDCFCRDSYWDLLDDYIENKITYEELVVGCLKLRQRE
jgi:hypothetical protein